MPTGTPQINSQPSGRFAAQSDVEDQFGKVNVATWSQLDGTVMVGNVAVADENRILRALEWADAKIVSIYFVQGNYATPIEPLGMDEILFTRWAAILAGTWLYLSRGLRDGDAEGNHLKWMQDEAVEEMMGHRGKEKLNAARRWPTSNAPVGYAPREL